MTCRKCQHSNVRKFGNYGKQRIQRYRCSDCRATFSMPPAKPLGNHTLEFDKAVQIVRLLMEGVTIRGTSRITGVHKNTIMSLSVTAGQKCLELLDSRIRDIRPRYVQADEIHTFRVHLTLRCTPAMAAGIADRAWTVAELLAGGESRVRAA